MDTVTTENATETFFEETQVEKRPSRNLRSDYPNWGEEYLDDFCTARLNERESNVAYGQAVSRCVWFEFGASNANCAQELARWESSYPSSS